MERLWWPEVGRGRPQGRVWRRVGRECQVGSGWAGRGGMVQVAVLVLVTIMAVRVHLGELYE